jgi:hypothetical protein
MKSFEMPSSEPTVGTYNYEVELLVKHADEAAGRAMYAEGAKMVRAVLYRDADLLLRLRALSEDLMGSRERFLRMKIISQKYQNANLKTAWFFVATTRIQVDTETIAM